MARAARRGNVDQAGYQGRSVRSRGAASALSRYPLARADRVGGVAESRSAPVSVGTRASHSGDVYAADALRPFGRNNAGAFDPAGDAGAAAGWSGAASVAVDCVGIRRSTDRAAPSIAGHTDRPV